MNDIPSMWRTELLHPQFVHFTVALLIIGSLLWVIAFFFNQRIGNFLSPCGQLLVILGTLFSWATIYTGNLADAEVGRTLCDPTVLEEHEYYGYSTAYFFSGISLLFLVKSFTTLLSNYRKIANVLVLVLMLGGIGYLTYSAHLGASVVYQQGGGVYHPSEDCSEFE